MSKSFIDNIKKAKWHIGFLALAIFLKTRSDKSMLKDYIFGSDGITNFLKKRKRRRNVGYLYIFD